MELAKEMRQEIGSSVPKLCGKGKIVDPLDA